MKTELTEKSKRIIDKAIRKTEIYLKNQGATDFIQFNLNFIRGFSSLFLIRDQEFLSLLDNPDDTEMYMNTLIYIRSLSVKHPMYNYFRQFLSLPNFMQEDIFIQSIHVVSELSEKGKIF